MQKKKKEEEEEDQKKWENFQNEQDLHYSCEMEKEKCGFYG